LQHRGASRLVIDGRKFAFSRHTLGQLGDVGGDAPRLVAGEDGGAPSWFCSKYIRKPTSTGSLPFPG